MSYRGRHLRLVRGGLGQTASFITLAAHSSQLVALQTALMQAGLLNIRTADGVIDSSASATLAAVQQWATSHGFTTGEITRTSDGGLSLPSSALDTILGGGASAPQAVTLTTAGKTTGASITQPNLTAGSGAVVGAGTGMMIGALAGMVLHAGSATRAAVLVGTGTLMGGALGALFGGMYRSSQV